MSWATSPCVRRRTVGTDPDTRRYEWDAENRLIGMTTPDGTRWRYRYGPLAAARRDFAWRKTAKRLTAPHPAPRPRSDGPCPRRVTVSVTHRFPDVKRSSMVSSPTGRKRAGRRAAVGLRLDGVALGDAHERRAYLGGGEFAAERHEAVRLSGLGDRPERVTGGRVDLEDGLQHDHPRMVRHALPTPRPA
ncbi:hypothetical protein [Streptomyces sp. NPDC013187]|uniref:hypothetical protein n=1 Tax=Streptomyces sp. NPDC013187 TaxID=3364865 RepID=UPI003698AF46